jgi:MoaA/NifB/PqqE/SkfB family radical SAM enzyme
MIAELPVLRVADKPIRRVANELYIEPTSVCNLHCKMCYTNVINGPGRRVLPAEQILALFQRFYETTPPPVLVYWCGTGEVFMHKDFPLMVNRLLEYGPAVRQTIQTNGTLRRLGELTSLERLDFRVSIDGVREVHEWHRGANTYDKTLDFCREALERGCRSLWVRLLLTRDNIYRLDEFHDDLRRRAGPRARLSLIVPFTNHTLRTVRGLSQAIAQQDVEDDRAVGEEEARAVLRREYGGRYLLEQDSPTVNNYLSLNTYGVYSCCNGIIKLGEVDTAIDVLKERLAASADECRGCALFPCM